MSEERKNVPAALFNRLLGTVVSPVVDSVDVDHIVERIDVNDVVSRVDLDAVIAESRRQRHAGPGRSRTASSTASIRTGSSTGSIPNRLLDRLDPDRLLDRLDLNRLLDRLDVDRLIGRIDLNALVQRVDLERGHRRRRHRSRDRPCGSGCRGRPCRPDRAVDRVDIDRAVDRVDLDRAVDRVDLNRAWIGSTSMPLSNEPSSAAIIARSTTGVFGRASRRGQDPGDGRRPGRASAPGPSVARRPSRDSGGPRPTPRARSSVPPDRVLTSRERAVAFQGRYAGSLSRFLAFVVDQFTIGALFALGALLVSAAVTVVSRNRPDAFRGSTPDRDRLRHSGRSSTTPGRPRRPEGRSERRSWAFSSSTATGQRVSGKTAALRTLVFPISFLLFGIGLILGLFRPDRRELHDLIAKTAVIYQWDAAIAEDDGSEPH